MLTTVYIPGRLRLYKLHKGELMKNLTLEQLETIHSLNMAITDAVEVLGIEETTTKLGIFLNKISKDQWMIESIKEEDCEDVENFWGINYGNEVKGSN